MAITTFDKLRNSSAADGAKKVAAAGKKVTGGQALAIPFGLLYVVTFIGAVTASYMLEGTNPWKTFTYQPGPWCELERTNNFMREPVNAWSDFSFLAVGLFMIYSGIHNMLWPVKNSKGEKAVNPIVAFPIVSIVWGVANVIHACGTFWYHSCRCREGKHYDEFAMFSISAFPFFYNFLRIAVARQASATVSRKEPAPHSAYLMSPEQKSEQDKVYQKVMVMFLGYAGFAFFCYHLFNFSIYNDILRDFVMGGILGLDVLTFVYYIYHHVQNQSQWNRDKKLLIAAIVLFVIGYAAHTLDRHSIMCSPTSVFQGHAIWHVFCAFALCVLYTMFRHEHFHVLSDTWTENKPVFC
jgi:hypothetical protein